MKPRFVGPASVPLVLASKSAIRLALLEAAGLAAEPLATNLDEDEIKAGMRAAGATVRDTAAALAEAKAMRASARRPEAFVIGCDQMLDCGGRWFDKPRDRAAAKAQLLALSGRRHTLHSAACVARNGERLWLEVTQATLVMRALSDEFLEAYLDAAGGAVLGSVGAYQLEGIGVQLFHAVEGDHFTVLGLPLLPLLAFLREHDMVPR
ncbi:MAG: Maf family protein [Alphaproteobacteria bacterium]|nr:Maf family protein [Alphaproteobacteria bacterium]